MGDNIPLIGRWHDLSEFSGIAVCESDDPQALSRWALNWNALLDLQIRMVLDDDEARAVGRQKLAETADVKATIIRN
jgi:hypothetical protein